MFNLDVQISLCGFQPNASLISSPSVSTVSLLTDSPSNNSNTSLLAVAATNSDCSGDFSFEDLFQQHAVPFEKFMEEITTITTNPSLVLKINNRYMNWASASPIILSAILYQKNLPTDTVNMVLDTHMPKTSELATTSTTTTASTKTITTTIKKEDKQQQQPANEQKRSGWGKMFWGGNKKAEPSTTASATSTQPNILTATTTMTTMTTTTTVTMGQNGKSNSTLNTKSEFDYHGMLMGDEDEEVASLNRAAVSNLAASMDEIEKTLLDDNGQSVTFDMDPQLPANVEETTLKLKKSHSSKETLGIYSFLVIEFLLLFKY